MQEKRYWQTLGEVNNSNPVETKEFSDELPVLNSIAEGITNESTGRRDFLKQLGFGLGAATLAASCEMPVRKSIPYVFKPEEITPGVANYYASSYTLGGEYISVLIKTREGRPIKIEGNPNSKISQGGTTALAQASVVSLYDNASRFKFPMKAGKEMSFAAIDAEIGAKLGAGKVVVLTSSINSPSSLAAINEFKTKYNATHVTHDAVSYSGILDAAETYLGVRAFPDFRFGEADVIVSIGADFAATWGNPVEHASDYAKRRKVSVQNSNMSRHIHFEAIPTATSSTSDKKYALSPSEEAMAVYELYNAVNSGEACKIAGVAETAKELLACKNRGMKSLVVCGVNDANVQGLVFAINNILGNFGTTIKGATNYKKSNDRETAALLADMNAGAVKSLIIIDTNPAYSIKGFAEAMKKVENTISLSDRHNETSDACVYVVPNHNALESWNDAEPKSGVYAICQPAISPLFNTRQYQETLLSWSGNNTSFYEYIKNTAKGKTELAAGYSSFDAFWDNAVQNSETAVGEGSSLSFNGSNIANAVAAVATYKKSELEVKFYLSVHGDGSYADNPYIQELPDPMSRITWDNYIVANPTWAAKNGLTPDLNTKEYKTITLTMNGASVTLPVYPLPGVANGTLGIKVGFGRKTVNAEFSRGANVFPFMTTVNGNISSNAVASFKVTGEVAKLAAMQTYFTLDHQGLGGVKTRYVIKETSLNAYRKDPEAGNQIGGTPRKAWLEHHLVTLYGKHEMPGHQWGMVVDLNSCVGCGACVVACNIENNVPVVGQDQVHRSREMHWMRIDRYYTGDVENPEVTFQPMMCQHCDNAPCENVCPVSATNHSSEGLNQMAYNRCIGTRYCANNCPYKVRRFNWYDYTGSDSFNEQSFGVDNYDDKLGRFDSLARMVLNPDVTTRSRGVIEKCSFCVQRIQGAKLDAKKENRTLRDGDVKSACQTACPTNAITFGDVNNKDTQVHKLTMDERAFGVLEEIHTLPSVSYLTRVRNEDAIA